MTIQEAYNKGLDFLEIILKEAYNKNIFID
jgi:hypothetical protein